MDTLRKKLTSAVAATVVGVGAAAAVAAPASAEVFGCLSGNQWTCATVTAIDSGSALVFHNQPNYTGGVVPGSVRLGNGAWVVLDCWTTGPGDADGHGDTFWFKATFAGGEAQPGGGTADTGWVNDWYLTTGSYPQWSSQVPHC